MTGMDTVIDLTYTADLSKPLRPTVLRDLFVTGNQLAHRFTVALRDADLAPSLSGAAVEARFVRSDGATVVFPGTAEGNRVTATLPAACYAVPGRFTLDLRVALNGSITSVFFAEGALLRSETADAVADPSARIPSYDELIAKIAAFESQLSRRDRVPNLVVNGFFPADSVVNQRGESSYPGIKYGLDLWKGSSSATTAEVTAQGVRLTHGGTSGYAGIIQNFPDRVYERYKDATLTVAVCQADGTVTTRSGVPSAGAISASLPSGFAQIQVYADSDGANHLRLRLMHSNAGSSLTIRWVAVFPGAYTANSLPEVVDEPYDEKLTVCRRYYRKYAGLLVAGVAHSANSFAAALDFSDMAAIPSVASASVSWIDVGGSRITSGITTAVGGSHGRLNLTTTTAMSVNEGGAAYFSTLELTCEP